MGEKQTPGAGLPWGKIAAVLGGAGVTVIGVVRGLDPEVILFRAVVSAALLGAAGAALGFVANRYLCGK
ncbi:MAG TPA: hypothetical protein VFA26_06605 [Gemmataceae bacterium]|nr:hypothetical protein [Gemmataceae bacterium]